jgi:hypothetical protein
MRVHRTPIKIANTSASTSTRQPIATHFRTGPRPASDRIPRNTTTAVQAPNAATYHQFQYSNWIGQCSARGVGMVMRSVPR